ncbi:MAG: PSD1 and planctomycete cytochrome C domain-containing protein [Verrucomicrobiota bacterium]
MRYSSVTTIFVFASAAAGYAEDEIQFNRDIRPILSDACFECHGPDENARKGGFRLDLEKDAFTAGKSGIAPIVPGKPDQSELLARVLLPHDDIDVMPPPELNKNLTDTQKETLRKWIEQGAKYEGHWAFIAPERPEIPAAAADHPVDAFLNERLKREGLAMNAEADKETLLRRVSLDLIGLPPSLEEMDAFLANSSLEAYEKVVDRLLASPHFGERMAMEWLDLARYADSNGFQSDGSREMWIWRDWLIEAYNRNLPFDQFTIEQLAGDMLPDPTQDQIIATGFNRNHRLNGEGGRIVEEWFVETVIDRVETTTMTWMALTYNCARCHDHKYDPISQREFYEMFAFFNSNEETGVLAGANTPPVLQVEDEAAKARHLELHAVVQKAQEKTREAKKEVPAALAKWEAEQIQQLRDAEGSTGIWAGLKDETVKSVGGAEFTRQADASWLPSGKNPGNDVYEITAPLAEGKFGGVLLEVLPDKSFPNESLSRGRNGNFVLTGVEAILSAPNQKPTKIQWAKVEADYNQNGYAVDSILKNQADYSKKRVVGWATNSIAPEMRVPRRAIFLPSAAVDVSAGATLRIRLIHNSQFGDHNIGRFRISTTNRAPDQATLDGTGGLPEAIRAILAKEGVRTDEDRKTLEAYFAKQLDNPVNLAKAEEKKALDAKKSFLAKLPSVMIMKERSEPKDAFTLDRGEYDQPTNKVERALPAVMPPMPDGEPMNRLGLARWLVSGEHPLTARVWINRTWEQLFGTGIVKTSENFGSQAEWPEHPQLLDWLAVEFVSPTKLPAVNGEPAGAWDMKAMLKFLVMSDAYRQSSAASPDLYSRDPENRLLARGPRFRLRGELVRDQALAVSGLMAPKIGGKSVYPYMPAGVWSETNRYGNLKNYKASGGEDLYRRTFYTIWKRTAAPPTMLLFDAPNREVCTPKRSRTNTPLQALALLNEVTFVEAARSLAERMILEGGDDPNARITAGFRLATARKPDTATLATLRKGLDARLAEFNASPEAAMSLISHGDSTAAEEIAPPELAAYTVTANILLNLDRVITRD